MKKLILLLLICIPLNIYAEDIKYSNEYIEDENYIITKEKLYKFYEEEKVYSDEYYLEGENDKEYPYKSEEYITKEYETYEEVKESPNRVITKYNVNGYYSLKPINRIEIRGFLNNNPIYLTEIKIYYKNKEISYDYECFNCHGHIPITLNDNNTKNSDGHLKLDSVIEINFKEEYIPSELELILYFYPNGNLTYPFYIYYYDKEVTDKFYYNTDSSYYDYIQIKGEVKGKINYSSVGKYIYKMSKEDIKKYKWDDKLILSDEQLNEDFYQKIENKTLYKYTDKYFKYYKINKKYLKGYYLEMEEYIKDKEDYITRYKYTKKEEEKNCEIKHQETETNENKTLKVESTKDTNSQTKIDFIINKSTSPTSKDKSRHIYIAIISLALFLMGYMLYSLGKE